MTSSPLPIHCIPCEGGIPPLKKERILELLSGLSGWEWVEQAESPYISKTFSFKGFMHTMSFVNAVAYIANQEEHHPEMMVGFNYCTVRYTTHAIHGLSENDFICAKKIETLIT